MRCVVRVDMLWRRLVTVGTLTAVASLALTVDNARRIRVPAPTAVPDAEPLSILLPMRDEAANADACLRTVTAAADRWPGQVRIVVLDDDSTDDTAVILRRWAAHDSRVTVLRGNALPIGWLGKPWACHQLSVSAGAHGLYVFVDADVRLTPNALCATATEMRTAGLDLFCPYPQQIVGSGAERLVQPLLQWSWMSTLPLAVAERSPRPSLSAANGQLLAVDAGVYRRAGGHTAVRGEVLEDIALLRAVKSVGGRGVVGEGSALARCRMYHDWSEIRAGYGKSLWSAFGSPAAAAAVTSMLILTYVIPAVAALRGSRVGALGYLAGVTSRAIAARRTGGRIWPDCLAHPLSILLLAGLTADSVHTHRHGGWQWKGRDTVVDTDSTAASTAARGADGG